MGKCVNKFRFICIYYYPIYFTHTNIHFPYQTNICSLIFKLSYQHLLSLSPATAVLTVLDLILPDRYPCPRIAFFVRWFMYNFLVCQNL